MENRDERRDIVVDKETSSQSNSAKHVPFDCETEIFTSAGSLYEQAAALKLGAADLPSR